MTSILSIFKNCVWILRSLQYHQIQGELYNFGLPLKSFLKLCKLETLFPKNKKAVLRYTYAGNYAVQGIWPTADFYNDKPSLHKTDLSQIAKVPFNRIPANPHKNPTNKTNTGRAKLVSWIMVFFLSSLCSLLWEAERRLPLAGRPGERDRERDLLLLLLEGELEEDWLFLCLNDDCD